MTPGIVEQGVELTPLRLALTDEVVYLHPTMLYEDRMAVATPEGVTLELSLAGVGSRFIAASIDGMIELALIACSYIAARVLSDESQVFIALFFVFSFVVFFGYDIAWETLASGRTPGKRVAGLRVVKTSGAPVTFMSSAVRNLMRLIDILPSMYLIGIVSVLASSRNQRLGDLAAGTIVVREHRERGPRRRGKRAGTPGAATDWTGWTPSAAVSLRVEQLGAASWDVSTVTPAEVAAVRQFLTRRNSLTGPSRTRVAHEMATRLRPKVVGPEEGIGDELFLEALVVAKTERQ